MKSVSGHVEARQKWMHERMAEAAKISKFDNPPFLASAINTERMVCFSCSRLIAYSVCSLF